MLNYDYIRHLLQKFEEEKAVDEKKSFVTLAELHKVVACQKALVCWKGVKFGEQTKLALGGHGFLNSAGHSETHLDFSVGWVSAEGDGTVLTQQTSKMLLKEVMSRKLNPDQQEFTPQSESSVERQLCGYFEMRYKQELKRAAKKIQKHMGQGLDLQSEILTDIAQQEILNVGIYYGEYVICRNFLRYIEGEPFKTIKVSLKERSPSLNYLFQTLYRNYTMHLIFDETSSFLRNFTPETLQFYNSVSKEYRITYKHELARLGMTSLDLVDGWDFQDEELASIVAKKGESESEMYQGMIEHFRKNPLNQKPMVRGFNHTIRPFLMNPRL